MKEKVNYFDRRKSSVNPNREKFRPDTFNLLCFDTETFKHYETVTATKDDLPVIIPYLIGVHIYKPYHDPTIPFTYKEFVGFDCTEKFVSFLLSYADKGFKLVGFNLDYDIQAIRPWLEEAIFEYNKDKKEEDHVVFEYQLTDEGKKFISGALYTKKISQDFWRITSFVDLWMHDRTKSLASSLQDVDDYVWDNNGNLNTERASKPLFEAISKAIDIVKKHLPDNKEVQSLTPVKGAFRKGELKHYNKINMFKKGDYYYYYTTLDDYNKKQNFFKLDLEEELYYLIRDVVSLPLIYLYHKAFKIDNQVLLGLRMPREKDNTITLPSHGKYLFEEFIDEYMTESYRCGVSELDYLDMCYCYSGAFTASNKYITYLCPENFNSLFPNKSLFDSEGNSILRCYDINSLYPYVMNIHLPYGAVYSFKPRGSHLVWYEIIFNGDIEPGILYKWKPKYDFLDNSFFGDGFITKLNKLKIATKKYILKELFDLFVEMCDSNVEIVATHYQKTTRKQEKFINLLYEKKRNDNGQCTANQVKAVKLILNSLYGKFAEKFRTYKVFYTTDVESTINSIYPDYDPSAKKYKDKLVYKQEDLGCGFVKTLATTKNTDALGNPMRESILAGMFVTQKARWLLLSAIKKETDQGNVVLNCDTDSLKLIEFKPPKLNIHNKDLGAWKFEGSFTHFGHPNKHKKYFLVDALKTSKKPKDWIKVASAGIENDLIYDLRDNEPLEDIIERLKTLFDPKNRILIPNGKTIKRRNELWQIVIEDRDLKFAAYDNSILKPTHLLIDKRIVEYKE